MLRLFTHRVVPIALVLGTLAVLSGMASRMATWS